MKPGEMIAVDHRHHRGRDGLAIMEMRMNIKAPRCTMHDTGDREMETTQVMKVTAVGVEMVVMMMAMKMCEK